MLCKLKQINTQELAQGSEAHCILRSFMQPQELRLHKPFSNYIWGVYVCVRALTCKVHM